MYVKVNAYSNDEKSNVNIIQCFVMVIPFLRYVKCFSMFFNGNNILVLTSSLKS